MNATVNPTPDSAASPLADGLWDLVWTTEDVSTLLIGDRGKVSGPSYHAPIGRPLWMMETLSEGNGEVAAHQVAPLTLDDNSILT